jgi:hypothetical protein
MAEAKVAPYVRGGQDIRDNQSTFKWFWDATLVSIISIFVLLAILAYFFGRDVDRCKPGASSLANLPGNCAAAAPSK